MSAPGFFLIYSKKMYVAITIKLITRENEPITTKTNESTPLKCILDF